MFLKSNYAFFNTKQPKAKKFEPDIVNDTKSNDLCDKDQFTQETCWAISHSFARDTTIDIS
jgi:hypothetical protein